jgi:hypothetical protein
MSDGHYCIVRDLGLVKGGKGMRHHEVIIDFNRRGMLALLKRMFAVVKMPRRATPEIGSVPEPRIALLRGPSALQTDSSLSPPRMRSSRSALRR